MKPLPHHYALRLVATDDPHATVSGSDVPDLRTAPPSEFDGPGDAWSPEHLLMAAVETCFYFTFKAVARGTKLDVTSFALDGEGTLDRDAGTMRFTEIVLRPRVTLAPGTDPERARRVLEKSEKACLVSASLSTPVRLEPEILVG